MGCTGAFSASFRRWLRHCIAFTSLHPPGEPYRYPTDPMRILPSIIFCILPGCAFQSDTGTQINANDAKAAVIAFVREQPGQFIGNPDPARLSSLDLIDMENGTWIFGAFTVNPEKRCYSASLEVGALETYWYEGVLITHGGRVIAASNADIHAVALAALQDVIDG